MTDFLATAWGLRYPLAVILAAAYTVTAVTCWAEDAARTTARRQAPETTGEIA